MLRNGQVDEHIYERCGVKYEGWLRYYTCPFNNHLPQSLPWQSGYCVFRSDDLTFVCYRNPEVFLNRPQESYRQVYQRYDSIPAEEFHRHQSKQVQHYRENRSQMASQR
ncbi:unnamed protein product [Bursaphelenchus okinawaensis]|uniref:Uncharacterized protein n=1 Tax=Bursaphelenchus okinawaensis TaxID=465554 RepID=A0A811LTP3_9BILA|nr:unnamed protein product [Bursaphelenchus okinawaensis]CAG9127742.1 unnamed protein product [Bursaphelenchus okinawaensis]